jgi:hypothetical protein
MVWGRFWGGEARFSGLAGKSPGAKLRGLCAEGAEGLRRERFSFRLILKVTLTGKFTY